MAISSTSYSSGTLGFDGVVSGLQTTDILEKLMQLEKAPLARFDTRKKEIQARDKAYQDLRTRVSGFQSALKTLLLSSSVVGKSTSSSTSSVATAVANPDAINGSFSLNVSRLATATSVTSSRAISRGVDATVAIGTAGFAVTPTAGTFTINGAQITIAAGDTLNDVLAKITDSSAGGSGISTGVVATLVNDGNGNPNFIQLAPIPGNTNPTQLGGGSDTSNFLSAARLTATNAAGSIQSSSALGATQVSQALSSSGGRFNLAGGTTLAASGSFTINGATITWSNTDTLSSVMNRINASSAGVRASYDSRTDTLSLTNVSTGNQSISISEAASPAGQVGLLDALGIVGTAQQFGQTAEYTITQNGVVGPTQYSNSNSVSGAVSGVTLTLAATGTTTITVAQDTANAVKNVQSFVDQFNQLVDLVEQSTGYNATTKTGGVLMGDPSVQGLMSQIRSLVSSKSPSASGTYTTLASIGISTGVVGSAVGTTDHLTLDQSKLTSVLQSNPTAVTSVLTGTVTATLNPDTNGNARAGSWITSLSGTPIGSVYGTYKVTLDPSGTVTSVFAASGQSAQPAVSGSIAAAGSNTTLINGLTISTGALPATLRTDTIWFGQSGVLGRLNDYLNGVLGPNGAFTAEQNQSSSQLRDIDKQVRYATDRLELRRKTLQRQFTAMELAMNKLQMQGSQLFSKLGTSSDQ
jgi:flagellar hook-associated protein 2